MKTKSSLIFLSGVVIFTISIVLLCVSIKDSSLQNSHLIENYSQKNAGYEKESINDISSEKTHPKLIISEQSKTIGYEAIKMVISIVN